MCGSMVHIQSATAEIRRGQKEKKPKNKNIMSASATGAAITRLKSTALNQINFSVN